MNLLPESVQNAHKMGFPMPKSGAENSEISTLRCNTSAPWLKCFFVLTSEAKIGYDVPILYKKGEHHARSKTTGSQLD